MCRAKGQRREEQQAGVWGLLVDEKSWEMHGESWQPVSISVPLRETTKQYFHPIELMLDPD